jgi:hypothetical protein
MFVGRTVVRTPSRPPGRCRPIDHSASSACGHGAWPASTVNGLTVRSGRGPGHSPARAVAGDRVTALLRHVPAGAISGRANPGRRGPRRVARDWRCPSRRRRGGGGGRPRRPGRRGDPGVAASRPGAKHLPPQSAGRTAPPPPPPPRPVVPLAAHASCSYFEYSNPGVLYAANCITVVKGERTAYFPGAAGLSAVPPGRVPGRRPGPPPPAAGAFRMARITVENNSRDLTSSQRAAAGERADGPLAAARACPGDRQPPWSSPRGPGLVDVRWRPAAGCRSALAPRREQLGAMHVPPPAPAGRAASVRGCSELLTGPRSH